MAMPCLRLEADCAGLTLFREILGRMAVNIWFRNVVTSISVCTGSLKTGNMSKLRARSQSLLGSALNKTHKVIPFLGKSGCTPRCDLIKAATSAGAALIFASTSGRRYSESRQRNFISLPQNRGFLVLPFIGAVLDNVESF